jgi:hypothetical protein
MILESIFPNEEAFIQKMHKPLQRKFLRKWKHCKQMCRKEMYKITHEHLLEVRQFKTMNYYLEARYNETQLLPKGVQKQISNDVFSTILQSHSNKTTREVKSEIEDIIQKQVKIY